MVTTTERMLVYLTEHAKAWSDPPLYKLFHAELMALSDAIVEEEIVAKVRISYYLPRPITSEEVAEIVRGKVFAVDPWPQLTTNAYHITYGYGDFGMRRLEFAFPCPDGPRLPPRGG